MQEQFQEINEGQGVNRSMVKKFAYDDSTVNIVKFNETNLKDFLEPRVYVLKYHPMMGFYLKIKYDLMPVDKILFGSMERRAEKIIHTYITRDQKTGVLLTGQKGAGKTMTANLTANIAITRLGLPVILIEDRFTGSSFVDYIEDLGECVLMFDEFAKKYKNEEDRSEQDKLLGLFDGISREKRLIIATENNENEINEFFIARPGRFYYHFRYGKLSSEMVNEVCEFNKLSDQATKDIINIARSQTVFSFNILNSIIQEHQRYPQDKILDLIQDMNIGLQPVEVKIKVNKILVKKTGEILECFLSKLIVDMPNEENNTLFKFAHLNSEVERRKAVKGDMYSDYEHKYRTYWVGTHHIVAEEDDKIAFEIDPLDDENPIIIECQYLSEKEMKKESEKYTYFS